MRAASFVMAVTESVGPSGFGIAAISSPRMSTTDTNGHPVDIGISRWEGSGPAYGRELFYGPDGDLKATADPFARSADQVPFTQACNSEQGLAQGTFGALVGIVFVS